MTKYHSQAKSSVNCRKTANLATFPPKTWAGFAIAVIFLSGGLAACSDRTAQSPSTTETTPTTNPDVSSAPNSSSQMMSDRDFLTMMSAHHQQAIEMANLALTSAKRPEIKQLAQNIIKDQKSEIQTMATLYKTAYGTEIPSMKMGGGMMGKDVNSMNKDGDAPAERLRQRGMTQMPMNGMKMDMNAFKNAADFDKEFLRQMSVHHQTATQMSQMVLKTTKSPEIQTLARSIVKTQTAEIGQMQKWYQAWYKSDLPNNTSN
jgi:uncharacterized protein (DUF305 family)